MKEIQIEELRELQMQILDYVDAFCRKHDIKYTISGGTLLGAVRHGGFIPWDDDIDIQMLRSEYEKFTIIWNQHKNEHSYFELVNIESGNSMGYPFGKIHDTRTISYNRGLERTGVFIDLFPVDKVRDLEDFYVRHKAQAKALKARYASLLWIISKRYNIGYKAKLKAFIMKPRLSYNEIAEQINNRSKIYNEENCPLVFEMVCGMKCKQPIPIQVFRSYADISFEDRIYMAVKDYDTYLTNTFGDYMTPPPVSKQVKSHHFIAYWRDNHEN